MTVDPFPVLAASADAPLDELALALAAEFRPVDADRALARLDRLAACVDPDAIGPYAELEAVVEVLGGPRGFSGDRDTYDEPGNAMLDLVLERRRGLPALLGVVYAEVGRRAGIPLAGVELSGHAVCAHVGGPELLLVDPFNGGHPILSAGTPDLVHPASPQEIALHVLTELLHGSLRRWDLGCAVRAARLRLLLPAPDADRERYEREARALAARLN